MKRLKVCSLITAALVSTSITMQYDITKVSASTGNSTNAQIASVAQATDSKVTVDVTNTNSSATTNTLNPKFKITNTSGEAINLSDLNLKYYYNSDGSQKQNFWCDYSGTTSGNYSNFTGNVVGTINPYTGDDSTGTNTYLQVGFNGGTLEAGQTMEVMTRISKEDWTNYDQSNDYSFNASGTSPWDKVTAELGGAIIWGQGPKVINDSDIDVKKADVKLSDPTDIVENLTLNGNQFVGIKNGDTSLVEGTDYTVDGTKLTISKDYLKKLPEGSTNLVFDFNQGKDPVLVINAIGEQLDVVVGSATGKPGDTVTVPVTLKGIPADKGVYAYSFHVGYDTTKFSNVKVSAGEDCPDPESTFEGEVDQATGTIKVQYVNSTEDASEMISKDGVIVNLTFTIKDDATNGTNPLKITDGSFGYVVNNTDIGEYKTAYTDGNIKITDAPFHDSVITPKDATFDKEAAKDVSVGVTLNGNTLDGIYAIDSATGKETLLTSGKEYSIVNGNVVFSKDYLSKLPKGEAKFRFDFSDGTDPILTITIKAEQLDVTVGSATGKPGDTVTVPVTVKGIPTDKGVYAYSFHVGYDTTKFSNVKVSAGEDCPDPEATFEGSVDEATGTIKVQYVNSTEDASEMISKDGVIVNLTFTIKDDATNGTNPLKITDGSFGYVVDNTDIGEYKAGYTDGNIKITDAPHPNSVITPENATFDKEAAKDVSVGVTLNGNTLDGIYAIDSATGKETLLTSGKEYSIVNGNVVFSKDYLSQLPKGEAKFRFDFSDGTDPILTITIKSEQLDVTVGSAAGKPGDTVTVPVTVKGIPTDKGVYAYSFHVGYDTTKFSNVKVSAGEDCPDPEATFAGEVDQATGTIKVQYVNSTEDASEMISKDGVIVNLTFTIKDDATNGTSPLKITDGSFGYVVDNTDIGEYKAGYTDGVVDIGGAPIYKDSKLDKTSANFDLSKQADISVGVTYNGNTLSGIKDASGKALKSGTDYTVSGDTVVLSKSYLSTLPVGAAVLTFDFNNGADPTLTVNVSKTPLYVDSTLDKASVDNNLSSPADISVGVKYNGNTLSGIKDASGKVLKSGTDYTVSGDTVVLSKSYLSTLPVGATVLTFDFNNGNDPTLTVNSTKIPVPTTTQITTDAITAKAGDTITVPVLIKNAPATGITNMQIIVGYDSKVLTCTGFKNGELVTNPKTDFFGSNLTAKANVSLYYYDGSESGTSIKTDGVFATLTFKVNSSAVSGATQLTKGQMIVTDVDGKDIPFEINFGKITIQ